MTSWREVLPVHEACAKFPKITDDEFEALTTDLKLNGLRTPIVLFVAEHDGTGTGDAERRNAKALKGAVLLDGANRLDALEAGGVNLVTRGKFVVPDIDVGGADTVP